MKKILSLAVVSMVLSFPLSGWAGDDNLLENGNFEKGGNWPDDWGQPKSGGTLEKEDENHFVRLTAPEPGVETILYAAIKVEAGKAYELSYRVRVDKLTPGKEAWFDARIITNIKDESGEAFPSPAPVYFRKDTSKWVEKSVKFKIPENATKLEILAGLFRVEAGVLDIDDVVLKSIDPGSVK